MERSRQLSLLNNTRKLWTVGIDTTILQNSVNTPRLNRKYQALLFSHRYKFVRDRTLLRCVEELVYIETRQIFLYRERHYCWDANVCIFLIVLSHSSRIWNGMCDKKGAWQRKWVWGASKFSETEKYLHGSLRRVSRCKNGQWGAPLSVLHT